MTSYRKELYIPLDISELLHAALGPLGDVLESEDHRWAPMVRKVIDEYTRKRDEFLSTMHGDTVLVDVVRRTLDAADAVCDMTVHAMKEMEDFAQWDDEVKGESA